MHGVWAFFFSGIIGELTISLSSWSCVKRSLQMEGGNQMFDDWDFFFLGAEALYRGLWKGERGKEIH